MDEATQSNQPNAMRQLLTKWAELEPNRCKRETRPNPFLKPGEIERFDIATPYGWQTAYSHGDYYPDEYRGAMAVQWSVQEAIISRGWGFEMAFNTHHTNGAQVVVYYGVNWASSDLTDNPVEALLEAYLAALEANK